MKVSSPVGHTACRGDATSAAAQRGDATADLSRRVIVSLRGDRRDAHGELDDEPRAAADAVLHPRRATHGRAVFGDQCEAEAGADAVAGGAAASEPFEDPLAFTLGDAGPAVLDREAETVRARRRPSSMRRAPPPWLRAFSNKLPENTFESDLVERDLGRVPRAATIGTSGSP